MSITYDTSTGLRALTGGNLVSDIDTGFLSLAQDIVAAMGHALQEGVIDSGSFMVTQKSGGATMSVDVASNTGTGALVQNDSSAAGALSFVAPTGSATNIAIAAAHATLPRVDRVVVGLTGTVSAVTGTATAGATLANLTGAGAVPANSLLLADVLVGATVTSVTNSVIRDRRKWARGAHGRIVVSGGDYTVSNSAAYALLDATNLAPRVECSGVPIRVVLAGTCDVTALGNAFFSPQVDSAGVDGMPNVGSSTQAGIHVTYTSGINGGLLLTWEFTPAAGSHIIAPAFAGPVSGGANLIVRAQSGIPLMWSWQELLLQNTANNTTTTG